MNIDTPNLVSGRGYGITYWHELFTERQRTLLTTYCELIGDVSRKIDVDYQHKHLEINTEKKERYIKAIVTYLALGIGKIADYNSAFVLWSPTRDQAKNTFARQALPMTWGFAEVNPFARAAGDFSVSVDGISKVLEKFTNVTYGQSSQKDAFDIGTLNLTPIISTDPPYYDNVGYADLSDYFYIWLRCALKGFYPDLFATLATPKTTELVALNHRFQGDKIKAEKYFENGLRKVFQTFLNSADTKYPLTIYYAFRQTENEDEDEGKNNSLNEVLRASTGWETMLEGLIYNGFQITGTWPIRTERTGRMLSIGTNALASSIVLVCHPQPTDSSNTTRREFLSMLKREIPLALHKLQQGNIAPVDLAQAAIGPGMAIFSRYKAVLEADGSIMRVRAALTLINQALDQYLAEQEGEYDGDTRWALAWFEQYGHDQGPYGVAETLVKLRIPA